MRNFKKYFQISIVKRLPFRVQPLRHIKLRKKRARKKKKVKKWLWLGGLWLTSFFIASVVMAADLPVTSEFGWRVHPISGEYKFHAGVDLGYDYGTEVPALFAGQVLQADNYQDGYGNQCLIYRSEIDSYTRYAHMMDIMVNVGDVVVAGTIIGHVGSTGNSTGPHLHLEYIVPDGAGGYTYTNPLTLWGV